MLLSEEPPFSSFRIRWAEQQRGHPHTGEKCCNHSRERRESGKERGGGGDLPSAHVWNEIAMIFFNSLVKRSDYRSRGTFRLHPCHWELGGFAFIQCTAVTHPKIVLATVPRYSWTEVCVDKSENKMSLPCWKEINKTEFFVVVFFTAERWVCYSCWPHC